MKACKGLYLLAMFVITVSALGFAQGTYTQFDVPGSIETTCFGINTAGDIIGDYVEPGFHWHGFLFSGGIYTTIDYPAAAYTFPSGINDAGQIVGESGLDGFLYDIQTQTFTAIKYRNVLPTLPYSINNSGTIAGTIEHGLFSYVFELRGSSFKLIAPPGTDTDIVGGLTDSGGIVGNIASRSGHNRLFAYNGKYKPFHIPGVPEALVNGVNPTGTALVGFYPQSSGMTVGFLYQNKTLTTLQFPGSTLTIAAGINTAGTVVGLFSDSSNVHHGFIWIPPANAGTK